MLESLNSLLIISSYRGGTKQSLLNISKIFPDAMVQPWLIAEPRPFPSSTFFKKMTGIDPDEAFATSIVRSELPTSTMTISRRDLSTVAFSKFLIVWPMLLALFFVAITIVIFDSFAGCEHDCSMMNEFLAVFDSHLFSSQRLNAAIKSESPEIKATPSWTEHCLMGIMRRDPIIQYKSIDQNLRENEELTSHTDR